MKTTPASFTPRCFTIGVCVCFALARTYAVASTPGSLPASEPIHNPGRWWPTQAMPKALARTQRESDLPLPRRSYEMLAQSVAGLAAKAVNEGRSDEMVWVGTDNVDVEDWLARLLKRHPQIEMRGTFGLWELIERYARKGLIQGYILYRSDHSKGEMNQHRQGMDCSVNVATSLAGLFDAIIVDEGLEEEARTRGLKMLMDVRDKTQAWCFETYKDQFCRRMVCTQDPRKSNARDLAIAQKSFTLYGCDEPTPTVMKWLEPLSPVLGWNGGDEFKTTQMSTDWGEIQSVTDWCNILPVLMAGAEKTEPMKVPDFDPRTIDWSDTRSAVSFISTDGDNVQWFEIDFFRHNQNFWNSPDRGRIPFGWSCCFTQLAQLCPEAIDYALATRTPNDSFVEWGGGYWFLDRFGLLRTNRWELLAQQARRVWAMMQRTNTRIVGYNVTRFDSSDALKSYEVFAAQTTGLLAILVFQYSGYDAGAGKVFWVKDRDGIEIPVITARYSIWNHKSKRERMGTPAKVARVIRQTVEDSPAGELPRYDWVIAHVWSWFKESPGADENAEDMAQDNAAAQGGARGYAPVLWCAKRLPSSIRTASPEEMIWRMRMKRNPEQTQKLIQEMPGKSL